MYTINPKSTFVSISKYQMTFWVYLYAHIYTLHNTWGIQWKLLPEHTLFAESSRKFWFSNYGRYLIITGSLRYPLLWRKMNLNNFNMSIYCSILLANCVYDRNWWMNGKIHLSHTVYVWKRRKTNKLLLLENRNYDFGKGFNCFLCHFMEKY